MEWARPEAKAAGAVGKPPTGLWKGCGEAVEDSVEKAALVLWINGADAGAKSGYVLRHIL
jgi:hypothetical protein